MATTPIRIEGLLAKIEATYRTDPTPVNTVDGVRISDRIWSNMQIEYVAENTREDVTTGGLLPVLPGKPTGRMVTGTINVELRGFGAAYSAVNLPEADMLWRACGYSATVVITGGSESVTYAPADATHEGTTLWAYAKGDVFKINGVRCNYVWPVTAAELGTLTFEFQGFLDTDPAVAALPAITYNAQVPQPASGMTMTVGSWSPDVVSAEVNGGVELVRQLSGNHSTGVAAVEIARHRPTVQISAKTTALATYDPYTDRNTPTLRAIDWTLGATQYNRAKLAITNAYLDSITNADQDGFTAWDLGFFSTDLSIVYD